MAGHGRPPVDDPRTEKVHIRLTVGERAKLDVYAEEHGLTKTQVLVKAFDEMVERESK